MEYTQGEWRVMQNSNDGFQIGCEYELICYNNSPLANIHNAHLIAQSPKLLRACEILASCGVVEDGRVCERIMPSSSDILFAHEILQTLA